MLLFPVVLHRFLLLFFFVVFHFEYFCFFVRLRLDIFPFILVVLHLHFLFFRFHSMPRFVFLFAACHLLFQIKFFILCVHAFFVRARLPDHCTKCCVVFKSISSLLYMCAFIALNSIRFVCVSLSLSSSLFLSFLFARRHMVLVGCCCCCCTLIRFCSYVAYILLSRRSVKCVATVKRVAFLSTCSPWNTYNLNRSLAYLYSICALLLLRFFPFVMSVFYASLFR